MLEPKDFQFKIAEKGLQLLRTYGICYLAMQERTGKTLSAILIAEQSKANNILVVTKKKALDGWQWHFENFKTTKNYTLINYHSLHKLNNNEFELVILDEAHNYVSGYPKPSKTFKQLKPFTYNKPIIYLSATPHAQSYAQLFHQFALTKYSPWKSYKNFYHWFKNYGVPEEQWIAGRKIVKYNNIIEDKVLQDVENFFIIYTRQQLGFPFEPTDCVHYIELNEETIKKYNQLVRKNMLEIDGKLLICDTSMKLRTSLHMLEGGVAKIDNEYLILPNKEKIDYILNTWGDSDDIVIMYNYIAEGMKLRNYFKHALILQSTSYAEGIDLAHKKHLIIYSQDFSTARWTQRRARQASMHRKEDIVVHYLLVKKAISEQVYNTVSINKKNFVDSMFERYTLGG